MPKADGVKNFAVAYWVK